MDEIWQHCVSQHGDTCVVTLSGDVDVEAESLLVDVLTVEAERPGVAAIHVDLSGVTFLASCGINALLRGYHAATVSGRRFNLVAVHNPALRVLELTGLMPLLARDEGEQSRKAS
jgi:anti-sigma B factor antagonist